MPAWLIKITFQQSIDTALSRQSGGLSCRTKTACLSTSSPLCQIFEQNFNAKEIRKVTICFPLVCSLL